MTLIILDRDGVINHDSDHYIKSVDEWQPIEGSIEAIARLSRAGYTIAVATNQSGLARGLFSADELEAMHQKMCGLIESAGGKIAGIFFCPHHPDDNCDCRKPEPGLVDQIAEALAVDVSGAIFVGDSLKDLQVGLARGCIPMLVKTGKGEKTLRHLNDGALPGVEVAVFDNLKGVADALLQVQ